MACHMRKYAMEDDGAHVEKMPLEPGSRGARRVKGTVFELFCGAGGFAEGARYAGVTADIAVDHNRDACASYESNLGSHPLAFDVQDLSRLAAHGWRPEGGIRLLMADPPASPTALRTRVLAHTFSLIASLRPEHWLLASPVNISAEHPIRKGWDIDHVVLDFADFGGPEHIWTNFWYGRPYGSAKLVAPEPTHTSPKLARQTRVDGRVLEPWAFKKSKLSSVNAVLAHHGLKTMELRGDRVSRFDQAVAAMPPVVAHAIMRSVVEQMEKR